MNTSVKTINNQLSISLINSVIFFQQSVYLLLIQSFFRE